MRRLSPVLLRLATLSLLAWGVLHVTGGLVDAVMQWRGELLAMLGIPAPDILAAPDLARAMRGVTAVWSGAIVGLGVFAMAAARGALGGTPGLFARGDRRAWLLVVATLGPADLGAEICYVLLTPPFPASTVFPLGLATFLLAATLSAPAVWSRRDPGGDGRVEGVSTSGGITSKAPPATSRR